LKDLPNFIVGFSISLKLKNDKQSDAKNAARNNATKDVLGNNDTVNC
jgi:hypothetical protein